MSIQEIESAIMRLSVDELIDLSNWLEEYQVQVWDNQIENDLEDGRLDSLLAEIDASYDFGLAQPL